MQTLTTRSLMAVAAGLVLVGTANAQSDDFEAYPTGQPLDASGFWHNWDTVAAGVQPFIVITDNATTGLTATPPSGTQYVESKGGISTVPMGCTQCSDTVYEYGGIASGTYEFTIQTYVPNTFTGSSYLIFMNTYFDAGGPYNWSGQYHFEDATATIESDLAAAGMPTECTPGGNASIVFDQWVEFKLCIDLDADNCVASYNGIDIATYIWSLGVSGGGGITEFQALDIFPLDDMATAIYLDDMDLSPVASGCTATGGACSGGSGIGMPYCTPAVNNSTGGPANLTASGSTTAPFSVDLNTTSVPAGQFGYYIAGVNQAFIANPGGAQGNLCIGGPQVRITPSLQNSNNGTPGEMDWTVDVNNVDSLGASPSGDLAEVIEAGENWNFQLWYRDVNPTATSNFSNGVSIQF